MIHNPSMGGEYYQSSIDLKQCIGTKDGNSALQSPFRVPYSPI